MDVFVYYINRWIIRWELGFIWLGYRCHLTLLGSSFFFVFFFVYSHTNSLQFESWKSEGWMNLSCLVHDVSGISVSLVAFSDRSDNIPLPLQSYYYVDFIPVGLNYIYVWRLAICIHIFISRDQFDRWSKDTWSNKGAKFTFRKLIYSLQFCETCILNEIHTWKD